MKALLPLCISLVIISSFAGCSKGDVNLWMGAADRLEELLLAEAGEHKSDFTQDVRKQLREDFLRDLESLEGEDADRLATCVISARRLSQIYACRKDSPFAKRGPAAAQEPVAGEGDLPTDDGTQTATGVEAQETSSLAAPAEMRPEAGQPVLESPTGGQAIEAGGGSSDGKAGATPEEALKTILP